MARKSFALPLAGVVIFLVASVSSADVPHMINYQGKLTTASGGCLNDTVQMTFTIYSDSLGVSPDWTETQTEVVVKEGIFNVLLGSVDSIPESVFTGEIRFLGVAVGSDAEMTPRKAIVTVGYAYQAQNSDRAADADMVDGMHGDEFLRFIYQDSEYRNGGANLTWETVKSCTIPANNLTSRLVVFYDVQGISGISTASFWARITINGQQVDSIEAYRDQTEGTFHHRNSRAVALDVDNTVPLGITLDVRTNLFGPVAWNNSFLILGN